ncbi:MAG: GNAT family N-acetyltransferase [Muribaculaceae bacterium]|nr:GNAT family N-acetyltransferase [Muribaculaceae bacterium]
MERFDDFVIQSAHRSDAPIIATAVMEAVGSEICMNFAGSAERLSLVTEVFERLASDDCSQYSYRNALVAVAPGGRVAGVIVAYDGALLHSLRPRFIEIANEVLGLHMSDEDFVDETDESEVYIDSLYVLSEYRGRGLAGALIEAAIKRNSDCGKPAGLLVDPDNPKARKVYERLGFRDVGMRPFADVMMHHMQRG